MPDRAVVVPAGAGHRVGNVEFLARTADTPRFTFGIIEIAPGRVLDAHRHADEDDAFYILEGELTFVLGDERVAAGPGTFVLVPPGVEHGFRNDAAVASACSTSTRPPASTAASACATDGRAQRTRTIVPQSDASSANVPPAVRYRA